MSTRSGPTWTEEHRHRCEVRQLLVWRAERGRDWVHAFINGGRGPDGKPKRGIRQQRGDAAADRLMADCRRQFALGNTGADGAWLEAEALAS